MSETRQLFATPARTIEHVELDFDSCYRAVDSRDQRFDGWFVTAVTTTGIYCRPSCPAQTPKAQNVMFFPTGAAAHRLGFRACRRCRPDVAPGSPEWDNRADVVGRAMRLIADGIVDRGGVTMLAERLGYTSRHLTRMLSEEVGAGPLALARAQRAQTARTLIETTDMNLSEIAFAAGFSSVRQFNDTFREIYASTPSDLRIAAQRKRPTTSGTIALRLAYRPPLHRAALLEFLKLRAIAGVEVVTDEHYTRALRLPHGAATVMLTPLPEYVAATLHLADVRDLAPAVARCRRLLDLDSDPVAADAVLADDPALTELVLKEPGVRAPRAVDGFEIAVRAIVNQQISVAGAMTVLGRIVRYGRDPETSDPEVLTPFPAAAAVAEMPDEVFAMPAKRKATIKTLAAAIASGDLVLDAGVDRIAAEASLRAIPGIGEWTAAYIAMRALGDPDIFLTGDLGVLRSAAKLGLPDKPKQLEQHALRWSPWRSYAVIRLWRV
jgi:AraC family transcriptional regulator, regulatory protein of adaptative response / DNA-3-methyladenine glycosylase II